MNTYLKPTLVACSLALGTTPAYAVVDFYLAAKAYTKALPDGTTVPMWGYVADPGGLCYTTTGGNTGRLACVNALPDPISPGPRLTAKPTDPNTRIYLTNGLPEPTSIVITSQELPWSATSNGPTWNDGTLGSRGGDRTKKLRSFGREAPANGGRMSYRWTNFRQNPLIKNGTFLYHSGTWPQKQVYMGLYGAVTKDAAAATTTTPAEAYPGVPYDNEVTLFYSEIDPALNRAIADGSYSTSIDYHARWFLVNGEPFEPGMTPDIAAGAAGSNTLLRLLSAAGETHVAVLQGLHMDIHAEDGFRYNWQDGTSKNYVPHTQYSAMLPPLKTKDAIVTAPAGGRYAVYDGNGYMTNPTDPTDTLVSDNVGGMLRYLSFDAGPPPGGNPVALDDPGLVVAEDSVLSEPDPGVLGNDTAASGSALPASAEAVLVAGPANGSLTLNPDGSFTYTPNPNFDAVDNFYYKVVDSLSGLESAQATVTITLTPANDPPVITSTPLRAASEGEAYSYDVDATDPDTGDTLTYALTAAPAGMSIDSVTGLISWTPAAADVGDQTVTVTATDTATASDSQTFTVTVTGVAATPPQAVADSFSVNEDAILDQVAPGVLANDTPTEGDPMTAVLVSGPKCAWTAGPPGAAAFVLNPDGSFHYEPIPDWNSSLPAGGASPCPSHSGPDSFTYQASDKDGNSATVTVEITVNERNDAPIATADTLYMTAMGSMIFPAPGVLANDRDVDLIPFNPAALTAVRETNPNRGTITGWPLNGPGDGSFTYNFGNGRIGVVSTFQYHANDGLADSNTVTVTIRRELSVKVATCEWDMENGWCNWVIQGRNRVPNGSQIRVWEGPVGGKLLVTHTEAGNAAWSEKFKELRSAPPATGTVINVTVDGQPNAAIYNFPISVQ